MDGRGALPSSSGLSLGKAVAHGLAKDGPRGSRKWDPLGGAGQDGLPGRGETQKAFDAEGLNREKGEGTETRAGPWWPALPARQASRQREDWLSLGVAWGWYEGLPAHGMPL